MSLKNRLRQANDKSNSNNSLQVSANQRMYLPKDYPLVILEELKAYLPPLNPNEQKTLEASIKSEGVREPLIVWSNGQQDILVDGHNRYAICQKLNKKFAVHTRKFRDIEQVKEFMLNLQIGKRNLSKLHLSYLRGMNYDQLKNNVGEQSEQGRPTKEIVAEKFGVSPRSIMNDFNTFKGIQKLPKDIRERLMNHSLNIKKADLEKLGKEKEISTEVQVIDFLHSKVLVNDDYASDQDLQWFAERFQQKKAVKIEQKIGSPFELLLTKQQRSTAAILKQAKKFSQEEKQALADYYIALAEELKR